MANFIETGHAKNAANFADIISFCTGYGANYNPAKNALKLPSLTTLHNHANTAINAVHQANNAYNNAVNTRMLAFSSIKPLATRIVSALTATDATIEEIKDAKTINRKIQGGRAKAIVVPVDPNAPAPNNISASQQSYDQLIQHLDKLLILVQSIPSYTPNEADLNVAGLTAYKSHLEACNSSVTNSYTAVSNARISRNDTLYKKPNGLCPVAQEVKNYIKSIFGATSPQYKQVSGIKFTAPR